MNWNILYPIITGVILVIVAYYLPKSYIKDERKFSPTPATKWEKIWAFFRVIAVCMIIAALISNGMPYFALWAALATIPACIGLVLFYIKDSKLTLRDRIKMKRLEDEEEERIRYTQTDY